MLLIAIGVCVGLWFAGDTTKIINNKEEVVKEEEKGFLAAKIGKLKAFFSLVFGDLDEEIDLDKNNVRSEEIKISTENSKVEVYIVPTDEEMVIARDTKAIVESL